MCEVNEIQIHYSRFLTQEFYKDNYNISQRMEMLNALSDASMELSNVILIF
jgi:hypothetical protein